MCYMITISKLILNDLRLPYFNHHRNLMVQAGASTCSPARVVPGQKSQARLQAVVIPKWVLRNFNAEAICSEYSNGGMAE